MIVSKDYVKAVSEYLFSEQVDKDMFSSIYWGEIDPSLSGNVAEVVKSAVEKLPGYCKYNMSFAYSYTLQLQRQLRVAESNDSSPIKTGETAKTGKLPEKQEEAVEKALQATMSEYGLTVEPDGLKHQEELHKEALEGEEVILGGLLANGDETPVEVAYQIKKIDTAAKQIEKTLRNVSAIAESIVKGIEKVKSEWAETGYDYGRDLTKIDASEFSYLANEQTKKLFLLKYAKGELLQESSQDKKGLGDLIIAVDTSGSTMGNAYQGRICDLEMGIAFAMARLAIKNKCKVSMCFHTTRTWGHSKGFMRSNQELNKYFADKLVNSNLSSGDNSFSQVLTEIFEPLEGLHAGKRKPGVIFITDGHDRVSSATQELVRNIKKATGIRLYSYFVSSRDPRGYSKDLLDISDANYWVDASKDIGKQIDCFQEII